MKRNHLSLGNVYIKSHNNNSTIESLVGIRSYNSKTEKLSTVSTTFDKGHTVMLTVLEQGEGLPGIQQFL